MCSSRSEHVSSPTTHECLLCRPIEESVATLAQLVKEGKFDHIGLSEGSVSTICPAAETHPIAPVEIEYSLWSMEAKTNDVLETAKKLGIVVIAYYPLGRGILTGKWNEAEDLPVSFRPTFPSLFI